MSGTGTQTTTTGQLGFSDNFKKQMPTIIIASLTLTASLAWNDGFKALIDQYVPAQYRNAANAWLKVAYAFVLTAIIIFIITIILWKTSS